MIMACIASAKGFFALSVAPADLLRRFDHFAAIRSGLTNRRYFARQYR